MAQYRDIYINIIVAVLLQRYLNRMLIVLKLYCMHVQYEFKMGSTKQT